MRYAVVYSSRTGNTEQLAQAVREALPGQECLYFGPPDEAALEAQTVYAGFWTDKGSCDEEMARFLKRLTFCSAPPDSGARRPILSRFSAACAKTSRPQSAFWGNTCARAKCPKRCASGMRPWRPAPTGTPCWKTSTGRRPTPTSGIWRCWRMPCADEKGARPEKAGKERLLKNGKSAGPERGLRFFDAAGIWLWRGA